MKDLISRADAIADLEELAERYNGTVTADGVDLAIDRIKALPSAEAIPIVDLTDGKTKLKAEDWVYDDTPSAEAVQGEWIRVGHDIYECSLCHQNVMTKDIDCYSFCHRCGARMRGGDAE